MTDHRWDQATRTWQDRSPLDRPTSATDILRREGRQVVTGQGGRHSGAARDAREAFRDTLRSGKGGEDLADVLHKARKTVRQLKRMKSMGIVGLGAAIAVASTAIANVPSMGDAVANWKGLAASLDKDANNRLNQLVTFSEKDWIAEDQRAFAAKCVEFRRQIEWCRSYAGSCADICDELTDAFRSYWTTMALLVGTALATAGIAYAALALPATRIPGQIALRAVGVALTGAIAAKTAQLGAFMSTAASLFPSVYGGNAYIQIANLKPTGPLEVDFRRAAIDQSRPEDLPVPFRRPEGGPLPQGYEGFEWITPLREPPKTGAELDGG